MKDVFTHSHQNLGKKHQHNKNINNKINNNNNNNNKKKKKKKKKNDHGNNNDNNDWTRALKLFSPKQHNHVLPCDVTVQ